MRSDERREPTWSGARRPAQGDELPFGRPDASRETAGFSPIGRASGEPPSGPDDTPDLAGSARPRTDATTRRLALGAAGLAGLLVVLVGGWSLLGHRHGGIPVISAPSGPVRVKPLNPGGMQLTALPSMGTGMGGTPTLAPAPEQPRPQILQEQVDAARRDEKERAARLKAEQDATLPAAARPSAPAERRSAPVTAPEAAPRTAETQPPASTATAPSVPATSAGAGAGKQVQLGALASAQAANGEWKRLVARAPALMAGHTPIVEAASHGGQNFYRLRTGGFTSVAQASEFCVQVHAAGGACTLAGF